MNGFIELSEVTKSFGKEQIVSNANLSIPRRGLFAILGASGSGKTTLLNIISGLDVVYEGKCLVGNRFLKNMSERERQRFRLRHIGYLFQNFSLLELETVLSNVLLPLDALVKAPYHLKKRKALDLLSFVELENKGNQRVNTLSGGEKQRVALARALANDPAILLCDEPSGALDEKSAVKVFNLLQGIAKKRLVIVVSHDRDLVMNYADGIYEIHGGQVTYHEIEKEKKTETVPESLDLPRHKETPRLGWRYLLSHAFRLLKAKRKRSLVSEAAISVGLIGLGLSVYVTSSIAGELKGAFASLIPRNEIVMTPLNPVTNPISNVYSLGEEAVAGLCQDYVDEIKDWGTSYLVNFEEFYIDRNEFYVPHGHKEIVLPSFSLRSVNDYLWLDDHRTLRYFPETPRVMEDDQVVLGLPYADMFNLCFGLQILRNYEALGHYIALHGLPGVFRLANYSWSYEDEQLLKIVAVTATSTPTIFHLNHRWSTYLFESKMRFPSSDQPDSSLPWIMNKVHFIEAASELTELLKKLRNDRSTSSYVFERPDSRYVQSHCPVGEMCSLQRVYVYFADKSSVPYREIERMSKAFPDIKGRLLTTNGSYWAIPSSFMAGFAQMFYLSSSEETADVVIDAVSNIKKGESSIEIALPSGVVDGNFLRSVSGGFRLSSDLSRLKTGRTPTGIEEVVLSSSLYEKLGRLDEIVVVAQISEEETNGRIVRSFRKAFLKVVGLVESKKETMFVDGDWTIDFFRDSLGMSSFLLEPTGAVFSLPEEKVTEVGLSLSRLFPAYRFIDPGEAVTKSIASTTTYIGAILMAFSAVSLLISSLLFIIVTVIAVGENKGEAYLFYVIGLSRNDIARSYIGQVFLYAAISFGGSVLALLFSQISIHGFVAVNFSSSSPFVFSFVPLLAMGGFAFAGFFIVSLFLFLHFHRSKLVT